MKSKLLLLLNTGVLASTSTFAAISTSQIYFSYKNHQLRDHGSDQTNIANITKDMINTEFNLAPASTKLPSSITRPTNLQDYTINNVTVDVNIIFWNPNDGIGTLVYSVDIVKSGFTTKSISDIQIQYQTHEESDNQKIDAMTSSDVMDNLMLAGSSDTPPPSTPPTTTYNNRTINLVSGLEIVISNWAPDEDKGTISYDATISKGNHTSQVLTGLAVTGYESNQGILNNINASEVTTELLKNLDQTQLPSDAANVKPSDGNITIASIQVAMVISNWTSSDAAGTIVYTLALTKDSITKNFTNIIISNFKTSHAAIQDEINVITPGLVEAKLTFDTSKPAGWMNNPGPMKNESIGSVSNVSIIFTKWDNYTINGDISYEATIYKIGYTSKEITGVKGGFLLGNSYEGTFTTTAQKNAFDNINTSVANTQFKDEHNLTKVALPNAITIGTQAFYWPPLTSLSLPKVTTLETSAFEGARLTSLDLPEATTIGNKAVQESHITSLSLPKVVTMGDNAFENARLTSLNLPKVTTMGDHAFVHSPLTSISLPKVTSIGDGAFEHAKLTSLELPETISIDQWAFRESHITSLLLPKVTSIGDKAFAWAKLTSLNLPEAISIGDNAFASSSLTSLNLPEVITINTFAFNYSSMASLDLPKVKTIGYAAFSENKLLTHISLPVATQIGRLAFEKAPLTSLSIPAVTSIGDNAFPAIVNNSTTNVSMMSKFNTIPEKDRIFGVGKWNNITFL